MTSTLAPKSAERSVDAPTLDVSVVIPCLNEAGSIAACVRAADAALTEGGYEGEVVVVDNGSTDGSGALARAAGARVITEPRRGYGNAYLAGLAAARGTYIVMLDADMTYDAKGAATIRKAAGGTPLTTRRLSNFAGSRWKVSTLEVRGDSARFLSKELTLVEGPRSLKHCIG